MWFYWWDDAVQFADWLARGTLMRHKVRADPVQGWWAELADDMVLSEVCS